MKLLFLVFTATVAGVVREDKEKSWITLISTYTAVSRKVVLQKCKMSKGIMDNGGQQLLD